MQIKVTKNIKENPRGNDCITTIEIICDIPLSVTNPISEMENIVKNIKTLERSLIG